MLFNNFLQLKYLQIYNKFSYHSLTFYQVVRKRTSFTFKSKAAAKLEIIKYLKKSQEEIDTASKRVPNAV